MVFPQVFGCMISDVQQERYFIFGLIGITNLPIIIILAGKLLQNSCNALVSRAPEQMFSDNCTFVSITIALPKLNVGMNMNKYLSTSTMVFIVVPKSNLNANDIPANIATNIPETSSKIVITENPEAGVFNQKLN